MGTEKCQRCGKEIKDTDTEGIDYYYYKEQDKILCSKCGDYEDAMSQIELEDTENYCDNPYCLIKNCEGEH